MSRKLSDPYERLWIFSSALARDMESLWVLLRAETHGFELDGSTEVGDELAIGKLQSIADCFSVAISDGSEAYELACELRELLLLMGAMEAAIIVRSNPNPTHIRWSRSAFEAWPLFWQIVSKLASAVLTAMGREPYLFEGSSERIWLQDTSDPSNPDFY